MNEINMHLGDDGIYKQGTRNQQHTLATLQDGMVVTTAIRTANNDSNHQLAQYGNSVASVENINQKYWNAHANRQLIVNNEVGKYHALIIAQNNLLHRINYSEIRLWRYKNRLYFRDNSGQLIIDNHIEIQKELSSRFGSNVSIVNDMNDVLQNNNKVRVATIFITINSFPIVENELYEPDSKYELIQDSNGVWNRNLLANTRYLKSRLLPNKTDSYTKKLMSNIVKYSSDFVSQWIGNIGSDTDTILLLVGNQCLSEDLVISKVIKALFNTDIVVTLTDEMLQKQSFYEIVNGKLFLHVKHIPKDKKDQDLLKELLVSIIIQRSVLENGHTIPTQIKVIITIDEVDSFFQDFMEITTTLFIDTEENILTKFGAYSKVLLYKEIEKSLDYYSNEISSMSKNPLNLYKNDNQRYLKLVNEVATETLVSSNNLPVLDPYSDDYERFLPKGDYHTLITGLTRIGKSYLLLTLILRCVFRNDCSVILFDIHSDLAKKVARLVHDKERFVYIYPLLDNSYTPTTNLFETTDKSEKNIAKLSQLILRVLKSIKMDESFSGAMEELLLNCIRVLLRRGGGNFSELYRFMNDKRNQDLVKYAKNSPNILEEEYFNDYFTSATNTKDAVRRRLSTLLNDPLFANLMNGINTINLEKEMNTPGKIIVFDIPKGEMEDSYEYYIKFILEYIQILALKRVELPKDNRVLTHLFLDEAHNFITPNGNIETILAEAGKYHLYLTMANPAVTQYKSTNLRDIILSMTDAKIIGKNSNQTLEAMNKTLNTKLDNVENLSKGEFYIAVGNNDIVKVKNTEQFLDDNEEMSSIQWQEHKQYQLEHFYRPLEEQVVPQTTDEYLDKKIDDFIQNIKSRNLPAFQVIKDIDPDGYDEMEHNFNDGAGYIAQPELTKYFNKLHSDIYKQSNREFIKLLKSKDALFEQDAKINLKYKDKFRYALG